MNTLLAAVTPPPTASPSPSPSPLPVSVTFAREDLTATYTFWLAIATVLLAIVTVWMAVRGSVSEKWRSDDLDRRKRNAARMETSGILQAFRARVDFYSEELRQGRPPIANTEVVAPLVAALLQPQIAETYGDRYEGIVEAALSVQEAASALQRLVAVVAAATEFVAAQSFDEATLVEYGTKQNIGMDTMPPDLPAILVAMGHERVAERTSDAVRQVEIVVNDAIRKLNELDQPWVAETEPPSNHPWWHICLLLGR